MNQDQIKAIQSKVGVEADGFWGPQSIAATQKYLRGLMPTPHPFPTQGNVPEFYGAHGKSGGYTPPMTKFDLPFTVYYEKKPVLKLAAHDKCAASLERAFQRLSEVYPTEELRVKAGVSVYDGIYNPRPMRGGSSWSMHSWAIAIDLDAGRNGNNTPWPTKAHMPLEAMECFAAEGWLAAGAFWGRDAMHFQATRP
jgi:hypothetical protein